MSTMDYLEFKNYLEHGLFDKKKKQYYKEDYNNKKETPASFVYGKGSIVSKEDGKLYKHGSVSLKDHHSNVNTGKKFSGKFLESKSYYTKRVNKRSQDWEQAQEQMIKSANSQFDAKKDIERAESRLPMINKVKKRAKEVLDAYSRIDNAKKDLAKVGNNSAAAQNLKKQIQSAEEIINKNQQYWMFDALTEIDHYHNYGLVNKDEWSKYKEADAAYDKNNFRECAQKLSEIFHSAMYDDYLEHASIAGAPSRLRSKMQDAIYKKTGYQSKGSYAGAPVNAKQATTDQNKAVANARFSVSIKSAIEACNRDAAEAQSVYVEATTRINNIVARSRGEVNSIIRSVNEYNENVRNVRNQTITKKSTFSAVANGKLYQGVRDEQVPVDANRQFISFSAGAQKLSANKYVYKPKMLLIDSDPGTYKEV